MKESNLSALIKLYVSFALNEFAETPAQLENIIRD
jgi:hypothetical protein